MPAFTNGSSRASVLASSNGSVRLPLSTPRASQSFGRTAYTSGSCTPSAAVKLPLETVCQPSRAGTDAATSSWRGAPPQATWIVSGKVPAKV